MKKNFFVIVPLMTFLFNACSQDKSNLQLDYNQCKKNFNIKLIDHFPRYIHDAQNTVYTCKTNRRKNNFGLLLYEYGVDLDTVKSIVKSLKNNVIAKYTSSDSCLLIVNRFESKETINDNRIPDIGIVDNVCYGDKFPIPNFVDYEAYNQLEALRLDKGFDLYVLKAEPASNPGHEGLKLDPQMPIKWKNGYSKGIAINTQKSIVIYWGIMW